MNALPHQPRTPELRFVFLLLAAGTSLALLIGLAGLFPRFDTAAPGHAGEAEAAMASGASSPGAARSGHSPKIVRVGTEERIHQAIPVQAARAPAVASAPADAPNWPDSASEAASSGAQRSDFAARARTGETVRPSLGRVFPAFAPGVTGGERSADTGSPGEARQADVDPALSVADGSALTEIPAAAPAPVDGEPLSGIKIAYKQDPRLTRSLHMGERWVSPTTYTRVGEGEVLWLEAKAEGLGSGGHSFGVVSEWSAADPEMIEVLPGERGNSVRIIVRRPGQTTLSVAAQGYSQQLLVSAAYRSGTLIAEIAPIQ